MKVLSKGISLVLFFEVKAEKTMKFIQFKRHLIDLANQIYATKMISSSFHAEDAFLKKLDLLGEFSKETKSSLTQSRDLGSEVMDEVSVGEEFNYSERCVLLKLKNYMPGQDKTMTLHSYLVSENSFEISCELDVRSLRVEPSISFESRALNGAQMSIEDNNWQKNCRCLIL